MRYFLDENLHPGAAAHARTLGADAASSHGLQRNGLSDAEQLQFAVEQGRCFVTRDYADFHRLTLEYQRAGLPHSGVLMVPPSLPNDRPQRIAEALVRYDREHPEGIPPYMIDYLAPTKE
jgi:predicted nuclease of predicted toxin-antitoxin system